MPTLAFAAIVPAHPPPHTSASPFLIVFRKTTAKQCVSLLNIFPFREGEKGALIYNLATKIVLVKRLNFAFASFPPNTIHTL
jgi:hypothetical protein